jgi:hypothetical protein
MDDDVEHPALPIDVRAALHTAGHEVHDLGFDGVEDSAPLVHAGDPEEQPESAEELAHRLGPDLAGRSRAERTD